MKHLKGSCLCRAIEFSIPDEFAYIVYCHCNECRKFSGSDYSITGGVKNSEVAIEKGEENLRYYRKTENSAMGFCVCCGSSLWVKKSDRPLFHLRLGSLDDFPSQRPSMHIMVAEKPPWHEISDDLPQYEGLPPKR